MFNLEVKKTETSYAERYPVPSIFSTKRENHVSRRVPGKFELRFFFFIETVLSVFLRDLTFQSVTLQEYRKIAKQEYKSLSKEARTNLKRTAKRLTTINAKKLKNWMNEKVNVDNLRNDIEDVKDYAIEAASKEELLNIYQLILRLSQNRQIEVET